MADLMPTHAHQNPLWVLAYDDYPMDSIREKQKWIPKALEADAWFSFYHDAYYRCLEMGSGWKNHYYIGQEAGRSGEIIKRFKPINIKDRKRH